MSAELHITMTRDEYDKGLRQARRRAQWELGDPSWADVIVGALLHPEADREALELESDA